MEGLEHLARWRLKQDFCFLSWQPEPERHGPVEPGSMGAEEGFDPKERAESALDLQTLGETKLVAEWADFGAIVCA